MGGSWRVGLLSSVSEAYSGGFVLDARDSLLLPGFVDCHVHYPQIRMIGAMGLELLDWLRQRALPEEARLADSAYAGEVAAEFVRGLAAAGTTTALVFGSHFQGAQEALFASALSRGLRVASGLVVSDRELVPELHVTVSDALGASRELISRWHGRGLLRYAVTPRFSASCSEAMLAMCGELLGDADGLLFTTHLNENVGEISLVRSRFPGRGTIWRLMSALDWWVGNRFLPTTYIRPTMSCGGWLSPARRSPTARARTRFSGVGYFRCGGMFLRAFESRWGATSARGQGSAC